MNIEKGRSYDDLLLKPQFSKVESRSEVNLQTEILPEITIQSPIISSPMDTVTEHELATNIYKAGGIGIIHRFCTIEEQYKEVEKTEGKVGGAIGINKSCMERAEALVDAGVDFICIDVAHGHMEKCINVVKEVSNTYDVPIMAGNVATKKGAKDLALAGADSIKVGIGPGSHCLTREVAGVGVPQATAIKNVKQALQELRYKTGDTTVIADGGIQSSGDITKALMLGADAVMIGGMFAGCEESPSETITVYGEEYKLSRGMASSEAREENNMDSKEAIEGAEGLTKYNGTIQTVVQDLNAGIRSGISYCGGYTIEEARENAEFVSVTPSVQQRNGTHGIYKNRD